MTDDRPDNILPFRRRTPSPAASADHPTDASATSHTADGTLPPTDQATADAADRRAVGGASAAVVGGNFSSSGDEKLHPGGDGGLADSGARERIRTDTAATLFVEAGAGSGKTSALVDRVRTLVLVDGVPLSSIAAVTFTEKAGAELRDRLRAEFERAWLAARDATDASTDAAPSDDAGVVLERAQEALDDLDGAAIGTLHSFAQRLLLAHPIEAGLPPLIDVLDEVGSSVAFEERWAVLQQQLLDDDEIAQPLLLAMAAGVELKHVRSLAKLFGNDWDLIGDRVLVEEPAPVELPDVAPLIAEAARIEEHGTRCRDRNDKLLEKLRKIASFGELLEGAADPETQIAVLKEVRDLKFGRAGRKENWPDVNRVRQDCTALVEQATGIVDTLLDACLRQLSTWVARRVLESAELRRQDGRLEFHDLLVLTRDLLRRDPEVRAALQERYTRLLLDEFQDTDPIQIELAARIAGGAAASQADWRDIDVPAGRLFVVGDPKQSIYRFRRADIATYLTAQETFGQTVALTTNFRSVPPVLDWVNHVFGSLIQASDGAQPSYQPLDRHRQGPPPGEPEAGDEKPAAEPVQLSLWDDDPSPDALAEKAPSDTADDRLGRVVVLGAEVHEDLPRSQASVLREREAADVAAVIQRMLADGTRIWDTRRQEWRQAGPGDVAVLVPARTSLPFLEDALDGAGVPYRAEASSLVYQSSEVRSLLACTRALADPSDQLALVTALRSPLFGCGDDDLYTWKRAGGSFTLTAPMKESLEPHPVGQAMRWLRRQHYEARWMAPSEVLATIVTERRMLEVAAGGPRARDAWRRLRFVTDQARAWSEVEHGGLRGYLAWAAHQGEETSRVAEAVLPETDADAVRVMTIHAAKGLEFPIVVLSGMTASPNRQRGVQVLWPPEGGYAVRFRKSVQTEDFELLQPLDEQMDDFERRRLLYVATTRARDHLVVSLHRGTRRMDSNAELLAAHGATEAEAFSGIPAPRAQDGRTEATAPPAYDEWLARMTKVRTRSRWKSAQSASGLEGTDPEVVLHGAEPGTAKAARDVELPPWSKGRYGTAVGRAVHGVLQDVDLATGAGLDDAVAAQCVAEGVAEFTDVVAALARSALESDVVRRAAAREHWRESFVGTVQEDGSVLEGFVDLIYREDDGSLVIVDYKTDAVPVEALPDRVAYYAPQLRTYAGAVRRSGATVSGTLLLFLNPNGAVASGT